MNITTGTLNLAFARHYSDVIRINSFIAGLLGFLAGIAVVCLFLKDRKLLSKQINRCVFYIIVAGVCHNMGAMASLTYYYDNNASFTCSFQGGITSFSNWAIGFANVLNAAFVFFKVVVAKDISSLAEIMYCLTAILCSFIVAVAGPISYGWTVWYAKVVFSSVCFISDKMSILRSGIQHGFMGTCLLIVTIAYLGVTAKLLSTKPDVVVYDRKNTVKISICCTYKFKMDQRTRAMIKLGIYPVVFWFCWISAILVRTIQYDENAIIPIDFFTFSFCIIYWLPFINCCWYFYLRKFYKLVCGAKIDSNTSNASSESSRTPPYPIRRNDKSSSEINNTDDNDNDNL
jgi:hypothetical protein